MEIHEIDVNKEARAKPYPNTFSKITISLYTHWGIYIPIGVYKSMSYKTFIYPNGYID